MKLILCGDCFDVFKLSLELRSCHCGKCVGRYDDDGSHSVTNGKGFALAIGNGSLFQAAVFGRSHFPTDIAGDGNRVTFLAWTRPHDGPKNPHSRVDPDLKMEKT